MSEKVKPTTASELVKPMLDSHPEVRPNAVQAEQKNFVPPPEPERREQASPDTEVFKDKTGEKFNPEKHYADKFGRPQFTDGGYFRKIPLKKRLKRQAMKTLGRPEESEPKPETSEAPEPEPTESPKASEPAAEQAQTPPAEHQTESGRKSEPVPEHRSYIPETETRKAPESQAADEYRVAAKALCQTIYTIGVSIGGVQCKPLPQHVESMENSWEAYFRQKGKVDVPPGVAVALSTGGYALFCYQSSQLVQQQVGGIRGWIVRKIGNWKTNRAARRASRKESAE